MHLLSSILPQASGRTSANQQQGILVAANDLLIVFSDMRDLFRLTIALNTLRMHKPTKAKQLLPSKLSQKNCHKSILLASSVRVKASHKFSGLKEKIMLMTLVENPAQGNEDRNSNLATSLPPSLSANCRRQYQQIDVDYDPQQRALWTTMKPIGVPCFNQNMVEEIHHCFYELRAYEGEHLFQNELNPVNYSVIASRHPTAFNLGGDLALFLTLIRTRNREALDHYARLCVNALYLRIRQFDSQVVTISLVQGDALGGGFEYALSSNVIIAEEGVRMGLPEVMFNLFPGMGAYSLLSRRVGTKLAEEMMISGNIYRAEDLQRMGVIDIVAPRGEGEKAVDQFIRKQGKRFNSLRSIYQCRQHISPISHDELQNIANLWVDAALRLEEHDMQIITRLVRSQRAEQEKRMLAGKGLRQRFINPPVA